MKLNSQISFLQTFGILLVVVGHSFYQHETNVIYRWIYTFHMPPFMFISGFLLRNGTERRSILLAEYKLFGKGGYLSKKMKRMLVPYFTISSIVFLPKVTLSGLASRHVELSWGGYFHQLLYPGDNVIIFFWFLPTLFIIFCICLYASRLFRRSIPYLLVLIVLLLLNLASPYINIQLFSINSVAKYLFYFVLGYYFCKQGWIVYLNTKASIVVALTLFLSVCFVMSSTTFGVIAAINGIVLSIGISSLYIKYKISFLNHLFGASYAIYLFSWFPQVASQQIFLGITHVHWYIGSVLAIITGVYFPWIIWKLLIKYRDKRMGRLFAFLTGL